MSVVYSVCAHLPVKQEVRVQIPSVTLTTRRRGSTEKGTALVKRLMLVQIQSSALIFSSLECAGFARDFAEVVDQVRFLARTLDYMTRGCAG